MLGYGMNRRVGFSLVAGLSFLVAFLALLPSCGSEEADWGARLSPHLSPISFGDIYPRPSGVAPEPGSNTYVPFEWTLLLQARGREPVLIDEICIVGDEHNGEPGNTAFSFEGPDVLEIPAQREAAIRITYEHRDTNRDLTDDGQPDPDQAALVIQSNAVDFPTLVIPICGRIIPASRERATVECHSPFEAPPQGEADRDMCGR